MRLRFTIRDLLWTAVAVALAAGWWLDHRQQIDRYERLADSTNTITIKVRGQAYEERIKELESALSHYKWLADKAEQVSELAPLPEAASNTKARPTTEPGGG